MKVKLISWQVKYQSNEKYVKSDSELSQNKKPNEFEWNFKKKIDKLKTNFLTFTCIDSCPLHNPSLEDVSNSWYIFGLAKQTQVNLIVRIYGMCSYSRGLRLKGSSYIWW